MEQGGGAGSVPGAGGAGGTVPPEAEGSSAPADPQAAQPQGGEAAPMEGTVPAATEVQDRAKDKLGREKTPAAALAQDGAQAEPGMEKAAAEAAGEKAETAPSPPEPRDGGKAAPTDGKVPAATKAQDGGKDEKDEPGKVKAPAAGEPVEGKAEPREEKAPAMGEPEGEQAAPVEVKGPAAAEAQDKGKDEATKGQAPDGKAELTEEKAPVAAEVGGKVTPAEETTLAVAQAQDGGKGDPTKEKTTAAAKEKVPAAAKAQDGGKKVAKAEKTPADKKPAKEKAPAAGKAQDGENKVAEAEKAPATKKVQEVEKEEPVKEKTTAPVKEKGPAAAKKSPAAGKAQDGGKEGAELGPPGAVAGDGGEGPAEAALEAQGKGEKVAKVEETKQQQPRDPEPPRPALLQSLSCPAACQREEHPGAEVMEMIPEETTVLEPGEGPTEPGPAPPALGDLQPPEPPRPAGSTGSPPERTLPGATEQPPDLTGATEQPGPGGQPSTEAEPPPSPYLSPDLGKEDPFEILDDVPPPPAPFAHRIVTLRSTSVSSQFNLSSKEILGGGKFGEVHTCTEKQTGLKLAAKVIRKQGAKDKEMVLLEIDVMNQLNHRNLIQLYDAIETPREIILFMEFVEGGELFERIIDDDYHLTEVDCMVFVQQICEGIRFMHHMRVLHLDLKPENILCVTATGHMVKIIDFGLARRYNPQEKLKVNFGTPEFLSPEVVNYEQVSYSTDMWSMGVITYMLLSGLSPFLGDNDTETLNNVLAANWYFDEETFESVSDEAKDFVSNLIIKEKSARMSASQCLQHPWLNNLAEKAKRCNRRLKSQVLLKKYVMRRRWK
ncbi:MYLK2 kinase, partial [Chordeiles acutipennis]|nr:MYLK2 kinase [Chordeiles acutipennis]